MNPEPKKKRRRVTKNPRNFKLNRMLDRRLTLMATLRGVTRTAVLERALDEFLPHLNTLRNQLKEHQQLNTSTT